MGAILNPTIRHGSCGMKSGDCPICSAGRPRHVVAEPPGAWVTAPLRTPLPGYLCLVGQAPCSGALSAP